MILLDTDVCIELLRGNETVIERRRAVPGDVAISFMSVGELFYGAKRSNSPDANTELVERFLITITILYPDFKIMRRFGEMKAQLASEGLLLPDADILIAATTLSRCEVLVTGNHNHFNRFTNLQLANWIKP